MINGPGVAGAVIPKPEELGSWNFERMFIPHYVSYVMCRMSNFFFFFFTFLILFFFIVKIFDKVVELVGGGSVINGAYPV
jgi:hypothetical protein